MTTTINIRTDKDVKMAAEALYKKLGLNLSTAINTFLRASIRQNGLPFDLVDEPDYNQETIDAIKEADRIARDPKVKGYKSVKAFMKALEE